MKSVKKTSVKKYQAGGAQTGRPISEKAAERKSSKGKGFISSPMGPTASGDKGKYVPITKQGRRDSKKTGMVSSSEMKPSRTIKQEGGSILTPHGRLKSKKTRSFYSEPTQSKASVSRTNRKGNTVTKTVETNKGFAGPMSDKTKTVTDKEGNVISEKTKNISSKAADRKSNRVINNVGRNANDTWAYKKGGATNVGKSTTTKKGSMATMSKAPITPKAAYGMAVKPGMMKKGGTAKKSK
jgi:hypothetical protein